MLSPFGTSEDDFQTQFDTQLQTDSSNIQDVFSIQNNFGELTRRSFDSNDSSESHDDLQIDSENENIQDNEEISDYLDGDQIQNQFESYIKREDENLQHKSNAINSYLNNKSKSYTDRNLRVRSRIDVEQTDSNYFMNNFDNSITLNDRLITLAKLKSTNNVVVVIL